MMSVHELKIVLEEPRKRQTDGRAPSVRQTAESPGPLRMLEAAFVGACTVALGK